MAREHKSPDGQPKQHTGDEAIDGVYDSDPKINKDAKKLDTVSYKEYIAQGLKAMDTTAITICMENNIHVLAFGLFEENALLRAVCGENIGTLIK